MMFTKCSTYHATLKYLHTSHSESTTFDDVAMKHDYQTFPNNDQLNLILNDRRFRKIKTFLADWYLQPQEGGQEVK